MSGNFGYCIDDQTSATASDCDSRNGYQLELDGLGTCFELVFLSFDSSELIVGFRVSRYALYL
jgi:hypothetical protein